MSAATHGAAPYYFVPGPSKWPLVGSIAMFFFMVGLSGLINEASYGSYSLALGFAILIYMFVGWFAKDLTMQADYSIRSDNQITGFRLLSFFRAVESLDSMLPLGFGNPTYIDLRWFARLVIL